MSVWLCDELGLPIQVLGDDAQHAMTIAFRFSTSTFVQDVSITLSFSLDRSRVPGTNFVTCLKIADLTVALEDTPMPDDSRVRLSRKQQARLYSLVSIISAFSDLTLITSSFCLYREKQLGVMNILNWNICGLESPRNVHHVQDMLYHHNPQILFIMKTKLDG